MKTKTPQLGFFLMFILSIFINQCKKDDEAPQATVLTASTNVAAKISEYKALFGGGDNGGDPGTKGTSGFREITWDGLTDAESAPNLYAPDLFNSPSAPRARGIVLSTPGTGLMVSADSNNPTNTPPSFGNINPKYTQIFPAFSAERLFSPVGKIADVRFYVPGSNTKAAVRGFGAVYVDVDRVENTAFEYFDINDKSLGTYATPVLNNGHVFLGVIFPDAIVHRVRIEYGNSKLGPDDGGSVDVSVMDNFIYGEPQAK